MSDLAAMDIGAREFGVVTEAGTVRFERLLPGPIERVWSYLTESEKRGTWLAAGPMELRVGGGVELHFRNADLSPVIEETPPRYKDTGCGGAHSCRITQCDPPRLLSMTWPGNTESEVTFELEPRGDKVLLALTHRRLTDRADMLNVAGGWHTHLDILVDKLNGRTPRPFWSTHARLAAEYERRLKA